MNKDLILREKLALQRTMLANQSTLLSFIRTSMYFLVAGISINNLTTVELGQIIEIVFIVISVILLTVGLVNYFAQKRKIAESEMHIGDYRLDYLKEKEV
jgi:putative membrane protein